MLCRRFDSNGISLIIFESAAEWNADKRYSKGVIKLEDTVVRVLFAAFLSGITFLAYKHPIGFRRIYGFIFGVSLIFVIGIWSWNAAISATHTALLEFIPVEKLDASLIKARILVIPDWYTALAYGLIVYLIILLFLPVIIDEGQAKPKDV